MPLNNFAEQNLESPMVSVIITTKNEEKHIRNCSQSVKKQTFPSDGIQLIVVDNNSSDKTVEIAKEYADKIFNLGPERSAQRNFGAEKAQGKYLLFLDADMVLSRNVIAECIEKCESEGFIALYIPERVIGGGFWTKVRDFERSFYNATCIDAFRFVLRESFMKLGGFDRSLTGPEDWDLDRRLKESGKVGITSAPLYHNEGEFSIRRYLKKKYYYFTGEEVYIRKWGKSDPIVKKQLGAYYRLFGVFKENGKWKKLVKNPILTMGMYFLRFIIGLTFVLAREKGDSNMYSRKLDC